MEKHSDHFADRLVRRSLKGGIPLFLFIMAMVAGLVALKFTPREEEPQIVVPMLDVLVSAPGLSADQVEAGGEVIVSVDVTNTGQRAGDEVVQMYARYPSSEVARPRQQLAGFSRVAIEPGATRTVELPLRADQLAYWNTDRKAFVASSGEIEILIGSSASRTSPGRPPRSVAS